MIENNFASINSSSLFLLLIIYPVPSALVTWMKIYYTGKLWSKIGNFPRDSSSGPWVQRWHVFSIRCSQGDGAKMTLWRILPAAAAALLVACASADPRYQSTLRPRQRGLRTLDDRTPTQFVGWVAHLILPLYWNYLLCWCSAKYVLVEVEYRYFKLSISDQR